MVGMFYFDTVSTEFSESASKTTLLSVSLYNFPLLVKIQPTCQTICMKSIPHYYLQHTAFYILLVQLKYVCVCLCIFLYILYCFKSGLVLCVL